MGSPQPPGFSPFILLTLLAVLAASSVTLWLIGRRAGARKRG